jgi:maltose/maltodextrin transport system substrate-binding protein
MLPMPTRNAIDSRRRLVLSAALAPAAALGLPSARAQGPQRPVTVWFTVEGAKGLRAVGERFTAATGVPLVVETPDPLDGPARFQQAAASGKGPDLYVYAHDRVGEWAAAGILHALEPPRRLREDIDPLAWQGFTQRGRVWGWPLAIEAVTLIHNRALVPEPPKSFDELVAIDDRLARDGRRAILWDYTNTYFTWPLLAAGGTHAFAPRGDGTHDPRRTGVASPGALRGAAWLARLLREGRMPVGSGYPEMEAAMAQGRVAMMINGPWAWVNLRRVGIDFGLARLPAVDGAPAAPFVGVKGLMLNRATRVRELAVEFVEQHLLTPEGLALVDRAEPIGAPASRSYAALLARDAVVGPRVAAILASARDGIVTPGIPEMGRFWSAMKTSLTLISEGRQTPEQALRAAERRILGG